MSNYRKVLNPYTGAYQRVLSDSYVQSISGGGGSSDYDSYRVLYVDNTRIETYIETGSISKPFKTIQAAVNKVKALGQWSFAFAILITGIYQETVYFEEYGLWDRPIIFMGQHTRAFVNPRWSPAPGQIYSIISTQNNQNIRFYLQDISVDQINLQASVNNLHLNSNNASFSGIFKGLRSCKLLNASGNLHFINCNGLRVHYNPSESTYPTVSNNITIELDNTKYKSPFFSNPMYSEITNLGLRNLTILDDPSNILNLRLFLKESMIGNMSTPPTYTISSLQTWYLINSFLFGSIVNNGTLHLLNSELTGTISGNIPIYGQTNKPTISFGIVAPISTPNKVGDVYLDTVLKKVYFATGTTNSADWTIVN